MTNYSGQVPKTDQYQSGFDRVKVDVGQTNFFLGKSQRCFHELNIAGNTTQTFRVVLPVPVIFTGFRISLDNGFVKVSVFEGGTPGGTFGTPLTVRNSNRLPVGADRHVSNYVTPVTISTGGTVTGGTLVDVERVKAATSNVNVAQVQANDFDVRGVPATTLYFQVQSLNNEAVTGTLHWNWEDR